MWEDVIGIVNEERGSNAGVEALINAPQFKGGREAKQARKAAAAEAVLATGAFDTTLKDYQSLLDLAKSQGAVGGGNRGACKICGQLGHLTKQCRNQFSKFFQPPGSGRSGGNELVANGVGTTQEESESDLSSLDSLSEEKSERESDSDSEGSSLERDRRRRKRKRSRKDGERSDRRERERKRDRSKRKRREKRREERKRRKRRDRSRSRSRS